MLLAISVDSIAVASIPSLTLSMLKRSVRQPGPRAFLDDPQTAGEPMDDEIGRAKSPPAGLYKPCILIIVVASIERFAYKGVASNLVTFLTQELNMTSSAAAKSVNSWYGVNSMLPLVGAFLAESYWDRYSTIFCSSLLYLLGFVALTSWAMLCTWMPTSTLFLPLYLISTAQGGYNPSLQAFGADQLDGDEDHDKSWFFQWWYFGICSGSLLGNSLMSYVQDSYGWMLGFSIPTIAMGISVLCFAVWSRCYVHKQKRQTANISLVAGDDEDAEIEMQPILNPVVNGTGLDHQLPAPSLPTLTVIKVVARLLPIWAVLLIFAVIFQQPSTFFTQQGMAMKHTVGSTNFKIPPAALQSSITISIIVLMPLYDRLIIPSIRLLTGNAKGITIFQRIGIGMFFSFTAMVVAAVVDWKRADSISEEGKLLSIFWLLPQYVLVGISDVFTVVGMQEFFYTQVPSTMKSIGIGVYLSVFGVGSFLGSFFITAIDFFTCDKGPAAGTCWFSDDMSESKLYKYYWFLAVCSSVSFLMFLCISRHFHVTRSFLHTQICK